MSITPLSREEVDLLLPASLALPAQEGARIVALHWLHGLRAARAAMAATATAASATAATEATDATASADPAALHRARVALRRLRATLRTHRDLIALGKRLPHTLRKLNQATNSARDADVQRAWLTAERDAFDGAARDEATRLLDELSQNSARAQRRVERAFSRHLDPVVDELALRLSVYKEQRTPGREMLRKSFAGAIAAHVQEGAAEIDVALRALTAVVEPLSAHTTEALHALRIMLKRQRAMLAPFVDTAPAVAAWYACATRGQDALGAMRDATLLADIAAQHGFEALEATVRAKALGHYHAFHRAWCADEQAVHGVTDTATRAVAAFDAIASANAIPREIERKYLLRAMPPFALTIEPTRIEQGWLPGERLRERVRRATRPDGTVRLTRTVKIGALGSRIELEEDASPALFEALWPHTVIARIRKERHPVPEGGLVWEIDRFLDRALVLAEVELSEQDAVPPAPDWLAPFVVRDVTDDPAYTNAAMAAHDTAGAHGDEGPARQPGTGEGSPGHAGPHE